MLKTFKNRFFEIIIENGFDPTNFKTEETMINDNPAFIIKYKNTMFRFIAMNLKNEFGNFGHQFSRFTEGYPLSDFPKKYSWFDIDDDETFKTFKYW
ncbi:MAG: hypothetical protein NTW80_08630, partial [Deltaproteobacteria bacterium]|nr:hypothetical protein [Deltaproteobacteria bacterium]